MKDKFAEIINYNKWLSTLKINTTLPYRVINQYSNENKREVFEMLNLFYEKYYSDKEERILILGSSPSMRSSGIIGIPFANAKQIKEEFDIDYTCKSYNNTSDHFMEEVIEKLGGYTVFYKKFYMNFVFPFPIQKFNTKSNFVNANYYENKKLYVELEPIIIESIKNIIKIGINRSVCYCIGTGENLKFLSSINEKYHFFDSIVALEHPRYIMQYNYKNKEKYIEKYVNTLRGNQ